MREINLKQVHLRINFVPLGFLFLVINFLWLVVDDPKLKSEQITKDKDTCHIKNLQPTHFDIFNVIIINSIYKQHPRIDCCSHG